MLRIGLLKQIRLASRRLRISSKIVIETAYPCSPRNFPRFLLQGYMYIEHLVEPHPEPCLLKPCIPSLASSYGMWVEYTRSDVQKPRIWGVGRSLVTNNAAWNPERPRIGYALIP